MLETTIKTRSDLKGLLMDAQDLFRDATSATGSKADELRSKGLTLLDAAIEKAQDAQSVAVTTSKEMAHSAGEYVRENPWKADAIVAGAALLASLLVKRNNQKRMHSFPSTRRPALRDLVACLIAAGIGHPLFESYSKEVQVTEVLGLFLLASLSFSRDAITYYLR